MASASPSALARGLCAGLGLWLLPTVQPSAAAAPAPPQGAEALTVEHEMLRVQGGGEIYELETLIVRPAGPGPWPMALVTHGTPAGGWAEIRAVSPFWREQEARDLARRGWAAAAVVRRGYGRSGGRFQGVASCADPDYVSAAAADAADLAAALDALRRRPWADARAKAVAVGASTGGFAVLALAAARPHDVGAVFAFSAGAGGRPGTGEVCREERLAALFGRLGGRAGGVPTLWVVGADDPLFPAAQQAAWLSAWSEGGGEAEAVVVPAGRGLRGNGHSLLGSHAAAAVWMPAVDRLLRAQGLPTWDAAPARAALAAAGGASWPAAARDAYARYLAGVSAEKAFAATPDGRWWGYAGGLKTTAEAEAWALRRCEERRPQGAAACALVAVNWNGPPG